MRTILHICDWYRVIGGAEKLLFDSLRLLEEAGYTNVVVYNEHKDQQPTRMRPEYACPGLENFTYTSPLARFRAIKTKRAIERILETHSPDVCHIHNFQNPYIAEYLIKRLPCVRSIHDPRLYCFTNSRLLPDGRICPYPLGRACLTNGCLSPGIFPRTIYDENARSVYNNLRIHKSMPVLVGESRAQIECMMQNGFSPDQIAWLPNFTPVQPEEEVRAYLAKHFRPEEKMVLFVGRALYEKGVHVLVEASQYIKSDCRIVLITAGAQLEEIRAKALSMSDRIEVIPGLPYEQTRAYYARSTVVVVPSVWIETFCIVGLEAYANMKPVIGSNVGGIRDWLKDNETGWFFECGNAEDLASKIDLVFQNPDRAQEMGYAAYNRARSFYNSDTYLGRLLAIYERAIGVFNGRKRIG